IKYIRITDFDDDGSVPGNEFATVRIVEDRYRLANGDVLFARSGATAGKTFIYSSDIGPAIFAGYCIRFRFDTKKALPTFIYFYTKTNRYLSWVRSIQRPSGQPNINKEEFKSFTIPLPKLSVQKELVAEMERARAARRRKLEQADALLASLDAFLLGRIGLTPRQKVYPLYFAACLGEAWNRCDPDFHSPKFKELRDSIEHCGHSVMPVGEICLSIKSGFAAGREMQAFDDVQGVPHIRPLNISAYGELGFEGTKYVPQESVPESEIIQEGEVLLNNTNSTEWVGKSTVFDAKRVCCCSNHITRLALKPGVAFPWYLACFFNAIRSTGYLGLIATNFVNQAGINTETISALRVPVPESKIQLEIVNELRKRRLEARRLREEAAREWEAAKARFEARLLDQGA
ncbi:MAG: restriction endonuclease subunit S, partial [bacterium]